jgi:endonuclease YncB( thermonuclease family)
MLEGLSMPRQLRLVVVLSLILLPPTVAFADFTGPVVSVLDGDTIEVLNDHHAERFRLSGIDCPEKGQAFGQKAKQSASALAFGQDVTLQTHGYDKYKRTLADVLLLDGTNVNHMLVKDGWCWWYRKYAPLDTELEKLKTNTREAKQGLWADPSPNPPVGLSQQHWQWNGLLNRSNQQHMPLIVHLRHNPIPLANSLGLLSVVVEMQVFYVTSKFSDQIVIAFNA